MTGKRTKLTRLAAGTALAAALVCGGTIVGAKPGNYAVAAQAALAKGKVGKAIDYAEQAVMINPRDAATRALLGAAYLRAGRFASAVDAYDAALELGDESVGTVLGLALAETAQGHDEAALELLNDWRDLIPASDLGLAYALAGNTGRGTAILADALRGGDRTAKTRQNLAFAYALDGRWREARLMIAQDVAADKVDARIGEWAMLAKPEDTLARVAHLLGVPVVADAGQPAALALANFPGPEQLAAADAPPPVEAAPAEAAPVEEPAMVAAAPGAEQPVAAPIEFAALDRPAAGVASDSPTFTAVPVIQPIVAGTAAKPKFRTKVRVVGSFVAQGSPAFAPGKGRSLTAPRPAPRIVAGGSHWVQLGSYIDPAIAKDGWGKFTSRTPALKTYQPTTTTATVNGVRVWRVAATGFPSYGNAATVCRTVKARGGACLVVTAPKALGGGSGITARR